MTMPVRAALYLRVSTGRQVDSDLSIPDQRRQAKAYCAWRGWEIVADYVEPGASATDDRRPEFQRMIDARSCARSSLLQAQKRQVLACPVLYTDMARSERFDLPTLGIEIRCSIQLSYERVPARLPDLAGLGQRAASPAASGRA